MSKRRLITADISTTEKKIRRVSSSSKSVVATTPSSSKHTDTKSRKSSNIQNVRNFVLVWLDTNLYEESNSGCHNTINQLRTVVNTIMTFTDTVRFIDFLTHTRDENVFIILCAPLAQRTVPFIHEIAHVDSVYILSKNKSEDACWTHQWGKVKGVFSEIMLICEKLKQATKQLDQDTISITFAPPNGATLNQNLDKLDQSFMHTQILKDILLTINFDESHIKQFVDYYRVEYEGNDYAISNIDNFAGHYREHSPIWWYTSESFLYQMVNRALRLMNVNIIVKLGFYISDLNRHIAQLHLQQLSDNQHSQPFKVYRGQGFLKADFNQMMKTTGRLMSFNNFLSTSRNQEVAITFAESSQNNHDSIGVFFEITVDPSKKTTTPFAFVNEGNFHQTENEILFSMHAVFRVEKITPMTNDIHLWKVEITLTDDNDHELTSLKEYMQNETKGWGGWYKLGFLFIHLGQFDKAQNLLKVFQDQTTDNKHNALRFNLLGMTKFGLGQYSKALSYYEKALGIRQEALPPNHPEFATSYTYIGQVYLDMGEYSKALSYYEKALGIQQEALSPNHPHLAASYSNIGQVYSTMGQYSKALSYYEKALGIRQEALPPNHPQLATSYTNIGQVYFNMGQYSKALSYYEKALGIRQEALPPNHPEFATSYTYIGQVYLDMGEYFKALSYYEKALGIQQEALPPNHPHLAASYSNIGQVYSTMGQYSKALSYYEKALGIRQEALPPNHPQLATSYTNIGQVYFNMGEYSKALSYYEKALGIRQEALSPNHPHLATSYINIGQVYSNMEQYSKALLYYEKALGIQQEALPPNHPHLATSYNNIGHVYSNMGEYSKALSYYEKALGIQQEALPPNHPHLATSYNNIGQVYSKMGEQTKAVSFCERAVAVGQQSLPENHPHLHGYRENLKCVKENL